MASLALAPEAPVPPHVAVALSIRERLLQGEPVDRPVLRSLFETCTGGSDADGAWSLRQAFDAVELAEAMLLADPRWQLLEGAPAQILARLQAFAARLPLQSHRSEEQVALQQFSTPLPLAWLAGLAGDPCPGELILEPSAGNGLLAASLARGGGRLLLNELDGHRRSGLAAVFPDAEVTGHDAELIDDLLGADLRPALIVMNPPFARSFGRGEDRHAAGRHLLSALSRLAIGGRLVAIMPDGFCSTGSGRKMRARADARARLRLEARIGSGAFARRGTGVAVRLLVYESAAAAPPPLHVEIEDLPRLLTLIGQLGRREPVDDEYSGRLRLPTLFKRTAAPPLRPVAPPPSTALRRDVAAEPVRLTILAEPAPVADAVGLYLPYRPTRIAIDGAAEHPTPLVESMTMGAIDAPVPDHVPILPPRLVDDAILSIAQLETLVYAGAAFGRDLPGRYAAIEEGMALRPDEAGKAYRAGYFLGDGTGAGKGRQVAGAILDQWLRGNRRHIWISKNEALLEDARRDWTALGGLALDVQPLSRWPLGAPIGMDDGILFVTYPTLRSGRADATRLRQIIDWAGEDYAGLITFDEAHAMANAAGGEGCRGRAKGSEQGVAGLRLQNLLPRARILYASATGASDVNNLAYATRLGLWGPGTAFADREAFVAAIRAGGIAAMELVARDLKALGLYTARALSFAGVEYDVLEHKLTGEQIAVYDAYADAWAIIHANLEAALEATRVVDAATGGTLNANAKSAALSRFESTKQRFFGQLLLSMKLPSLLPAIETDLEAGHAVVVQLVSTAEAMLGRRLADMTAEERAALEVDLSPRELVVDYLTAAFPTRQMRLFTDGEGNTRSEPMTDEEGRPVHSQIALEARDGLIERLCALPPIATALDAIIGRFGAGQVAEVTGRTRRLVTGADGRQKLERRGGGANLAETRSFMAGDKKILIFSDAGGTGRSYHACLDAPNRARRIHYLLEPGWRADVAIQGLGRTHRTRQASAPLFRPVTTDVRGERRFISTIARRLDSLGALTRGQRQTGGQNLFDPADNLESDHAREALAAWYRLLHRGRLQSVTLERFQDLTGLKLEAEGGGLREDLPPIQRWLNRLLALRIGLQNAIFDEFLALIEARIAAAREAGTLELGVETVPVENLSIAGDLVIRTDPRSGATTHLLRLELERRICPLGLQRVQAMRADRPGAQPMVNGRSGRAALRVKARSLMSEDGLPISRFELIRPLRRDHVACDRLAETAWLPAGETEFAAAWEAEVREAEASLRRETMHLATGLLLPVWDKLPEERVQVVRIAAADGRTLLGREIPAASLGALAERLGVAIDARMPVPDLVAAVMGSGGPLPLAGVEALSVRRALVNGSQRLELSGFSAARLGWYKALGCFTEIIRYRTRLFVPVDRAADILERGGRSVARRGGERKGSVKRVSDGCGKSAPALIRKAFQMIRTIPLNKLVASPRNVRRRGSVEADLELKADIEARGVLQNLVVTAVGKPRGCFAVEAGERRRRALQALAEDGKLARDFEVCCLVVDDVEAGREASLAENFQRLAMNPADECLAFQALLDQGADVEGIARRFGLAMRFVEGRLRLANLAPVVFEALGAGDIGLDVAKAYAATPDQERQAFVFEQLGRGYSSNHPDSIRRMMTQTTVSAGDRRALFVGEEAYVAAGGRIEQDLFSDAGAARWLDIALLERLAGEKMEAIAAETTAETGLAFVKPTLGAWVPHEALAGYRRVPVEGPSLSDEDAARRDELYQALEDLSAELDDDRLEAAARVEGAARVKSLGAELDAIENRPPVLDAELAAKVGAFLILDEAGQARLDGNYYAPVDDDREGEGGRSDEETGEVAGKRGTGLSQRLVDELAIQRRDILAVHVAADPGLALDLAIFLMIDREAGYSSERRGSSLNAAPPANPVADFKAPDAAATIAREKAADTLDRGWTGGATLAARFDAFRALGETERAAWLGHAVARTLEASLNLPGDRSCAFHAHLAGLLGIDVARWWRPTGANYFDRVPKALALAALGEVGGEALAARYASAKKAELAEACERIFAGDFIAEVEVKEAAMAWVPDAMRFAAAMVEPGCDGHDGDADPRAGDDDKGAPDPAFVDEAA